MIYAKTEKFQLSIFKVQTQKVITCATLHISFHALSPGVPLQENSVSNRSLASFTADIYTQVAILMILD